MVGLPRRYYAGATNRQKHSSRGTRQGFVKGAKVACLLTKVAQARMSCVGWSGARGRSIEIVLAPEHPTREGI
jgi:hypothetical protein